MVKTKKHLEIDKALQFLGDVYLSQGDEYMQVSLFVALDGGQNAAMLRLGDIEKGRGDWHRTVEFWTPARLLFERSPQVKQVAQIDNRIANKSDNVSETRQSCHGRKYTRHKCGVE
jgi:hypothetical protein